MPELPEAETIARGVHPRVAGRRVQEVQILRPGLLPQGERTFSTRLAGARILKVGRRGKNLVFRLEGGHVLLVNLGMTGRVLVPGPSPSPGNPAPHPPEAGHPGVRLRLDDGTEVVYDDARRFGTLEVLNPGEWRARHRALGPEPLSPGFTAERLTAGLARRRSPIRSWLLDQRRIAGVGNIYANEALWTARVHPLRQAGSLTGPEVARLRRGIRSILRRAIEARGTTLRDYRDADGTRGSFAALLRVYGREGEPCRRCGSSIERIVLSNRSAFLCPRCQPAPREPDAP